MTETQLTIYIGSDHGGFELKQRLLSILTEKGWHVIDCGAKELNPDDDYPVFAIAVGEKVAAGSVDAKTPLGILLCRSGAGMSMAANKVLGVRAAQAENADQAKHARKHNNANVITIAADELDTGQVTDIVEAFITTSFSGEERHQRRINLISDYEQNR